MAGGEGCSIIGMSSGARHFPHRHRWAYGAAKAVRFLAGPEPAWLTDNNLVIDGGRGTHLRRGANYGCCSANGASG